MSSIWCCKVLGLKLKSIIIPGPVIVEESYLGIKVSPFGAYDFSSSWVRKGEGRINRKFQQINLR
jgi:hypothetical protein